MAKMPMMGDKGKAKPKAKPKAAMKSKPKEPDATRGKAMPVKALLDAMAPAPPVGNAMPPQPSAVGPIPMRRPMPGGY